MKQDDRIFLQHILDEINYLSNESRVLTYEKLIENETLKRSFARSIEIIGEAIKNISEKLRKKYNTIEWKKIAGMRDVLIHHYFGVDYNVMWDVVKKRLPDLKVEIENILKNINF